MKTFIENFRARHGGVYQFLVFSLVSCAAAVVDFAVFNLLNLWLLAPLKTTSVTWWLLDYNAETGGGLCALIATASAYFCAQTVNFFVQRKYTFSATNSVAASGVMYFVMILVIWVIQVFMGAVFIGIFTPWAGDFIGGTLSRVANNTLSLAIQFPVNKFIIMRGKTARE